MSENSKDIKNYTKNILFSIFENIKYIFTSGEYKFHIIFTLIFIVYIILVKYLFEKNPLDIILKYNDISIVTSIFGAFVILLLFLFFKKREEFFNLNNKNIINSNNDVPGVNTILSKLLISIGIAIIITLFVYLFKNVPMASKTIFYFLNILIGLVVLTLLYKIISLYIERYKKINTGKFGKFIILLIDLVFYIPCLITDLINYIKIEYSITTRTEIILFLSVILLFVLRYFLPKITFNLINHKGLQITKKDDLYYLDEENNFNEIDKIKFKNDNYNKKDYNFALSSWFYLESQPPYTNKSYIKNTNIISYGNNIILNCNPKENKMTIFSTINNDITLLYETKIPYQKWTNVIFNYNGGILDIFINNKLVSSSKNVVFYITDNNIKTGKHNGLQGYIKNIIYFKNRLTKNEINWLYNYEKQ